ncbi:MAG TPA: hypothetical protein VGN63_04190 [Flavisolibacter sp.]|jgi:hypothetical protein|nr:hypothetical protein [Flavisolibacter sp.]
MYSAKFITLTGEHTSYRLRRVQSPVNLKTEALEEVIAILQACGTEAELLDFFFTTDYP